MKRILLAAFIAGSLLTPVTAFAWGEDGHSIVAELAQHRLSANAAKAIQTLLKSEYPASAQPAYDISPASTAS